MTTWPLHWTVPSGAKDTFVLLVALTPCDLSYGAMCKCTYSLTYLLLALNILIIVQAILASKWPSEVRVQLFYTCKSKFLANLPTA